MKPGEVFRTREIKDRMEDGKSWAEFRVDKQRRPKDQAVFVCLLLGYEKLIPGKPSDRIDVNEWLRANGWSRKDDKKAPKKPGRSRSNARRKGRSKPSR